MNKRSSFFPIKVFLVAPVLFLAAVFVSFAGGAREKGGGSESGGSKTGLGKIGVFVSILPEEYFAARIGGDRVTVSVLVPPGQSPHSYEPTPKQVQSLGLAAVYFSIGVDFEKAFLPQIGANLPNLPIIDSTLGITRRMLEAHDDGDGVESGPDPHVWLGLKEGKIIAQNVLNGLTKVAPEHKAEFEANYAALIKDVDSLYRELEVLLAPVKGKSVLVFHPAFGYFTDTFGLKQEAVETGGTEPSPKQLEDIIRKARAEGARVVFVQPQFARKSAETIAKAIGGAVVPIDPLAGDWLPNLKKIAEAVGAGLGGSP